MEKSFPWGRAPGQRICRSHQAHWHDSSMTRNTRAGAHNERERKKPSTKGSASIKERLITFWSSFFLVVFLQPVRGGSPCSHAYKLAPFLAGLYRQATGHGTADGATGSPIGILLTRYRYSLRLTGSGE
ncbi:hypothetical protein HDV63DRAFT_188996 [Trichoderma sp. SZMC 28014]